MKKKLFAGNHLNNVLPSRLLSILIFLILSLTVDGQTTTYTFDSNSWGASPADWTSGKNGLAYLSGRGIQVNTGATGAFGNSPVSFSNISKVVVNYSTNASSGAGTINAFAVTGTTAAAQSGTRIGTSQTISTTGGTANRTLTFTPTNAVTGFVQLYVTCTTNSVYVHSVEITYSSGPSVITGSITGSPFCVTASSGAAINIPYSISGTFSSNNIFTAQLSNASGVFPTTPLAIGSRTSSAAGSIAAIIPAGTATGTGYKVRVIASTASATATESAVFSINLRTSAVSPAVTQDLFTGSNGSPLTSSAAGSSARQWKYSTVAGGPYDNSIAGATAASYTPNFSTPGTYYVVCEATFSGCGAVVSNPVQINVTQARPLLTATPGNLSGFSYIESNGPSAVQSFKLSGSTLISSDPVVLVTINDHFEISENNNGPWLHDIQLASSYAGEEKTIYVRLKAGLTATNYTDTILINGGGTSQSDYEEVSLTGTVLPCLAPSIQSSILPFSNITTAGMTVNFAAGNGSGRIIKINTTNSFTDPANSTSLPSASGVYPGTGEQIIYVGNGTSSAVSGLSPSTTYWYRAYEYNVCSGTYTYSNQTSTNSPRSQATLCDIPSDPNGEITPLENPSCGIAVLTYEHGAGQPQAGISYYWQNAANGTSISDPVIFSGEAVISEPHNVTLSGDYYIRAYNGNCWSLGSYKTQTPISISSGTTISSQPANQNALAGSNVIFTLAASGTPPFIYQWQEKKPGLEESWTNTGTNSNKLTITEVPLLKTGFQYRVIVSNACNSKISDEVSLTVTQGPCISETFEKLTPVASSYATRTWTGDNGGSWTATDARTDQTITGKAVAIRNGVLTSPSFASGIGSITLTTKLPFSDNAGSLTVRVNGNSVGTIPYSATVQTTTISDINISGSAVVTLTSNGARVAIDDLHFTCYTPACSPATITVFPTSGPAGTVVTITGNNFTPASAVRFGTVSAAVEYISATQIKAIVPTDADPQTVTVDTNVDCDSQTSFTPINKETSGCEAIAAGAGNQNASDILIYEVYDENGGNGGVVTLYNRTGATVNLAGYAIQKAGDYGGTYSTYANLSGSIAPESVAVVAVSSSKCGYTSTGNGSFGAAGFNANDGFRLVKNSVTVDDVKVPNYIGFYLKRKNGYLSPSTIYTENQWTVQNITEGECLAGVVAQAPLVKISPTITVQPLFSLNCGVVTNSLAITAAEGYAGGNILEYQWYMLGTSGSWTAISDNALYSGATSQTLSISDLSGLNNYQYYCQVKENSQTCYTATNAAQIKEAANTWAGNVWSNGMPVLGSQVIIDGNYDTQVNGTLNVCDLTLNAGASIRIQPNYPVTVKGKIINNSSDANFVVESDANLIQTDNVVNEGRIRAERLVSDMNNITGQMDYVYWSSPVSGQIIKGAGGFSPNTPANGYLQYNESNDKFSVTNDPVFLPGKAYAIRAENGANGYSKTYTFSGIPNNGNLQYQNLKWTNADHGFNLVGNPYPSNIDFDLLHSANSGKIYSTVWFWTNNSYTAAQAGSAYSGNNYAVYNGTGGSPATYNPENPYNGSIIPNGKIKVGQGFIIQAKQSGKDLPLAFNNGIRVTDDGSFYQKSLKNRFWLSMSSPSNLVNTILVGYIPGAGNGYETDFDGELFTVGSDSFYSILGARKLAIQGRSDQFSTEDVVPLGNVFSISGNYTIRLQTSEGIFDGNQKIYLRDKTLRKTIDLNESHSYTFFAAKGTDENRFEVVYKDAVLNANESTFNDFTVYRDGTDYVIRSSKILGKVEVYDAAGRILIFKNTNNKELRVDVSSLSNGIYIIKTENSGDRKTKKIIR